MNGESTGKTGACFRGGRGAMRDSGLIHKESRHSVGETDEMLKGILQARA